MRARSPNEVLNWLVVLLAFSLPLYRPWVSLSAYLILVLWFFQGHIGRRVAQLRRHPATVAIVVFMAFSLLSLLWSEDPAAGFEYWRKYLYLLLAPAIASSLRPGIATASLYAFTTGAVVSVVMMIAVIVGDIHAGHIHPGNPAATMSHLDYSMVLAVAALLLLIQLSKRRPESRLGVVGCAALAIIIAGLIVNIGRSGQLAFAVSLVVVVVRLLHNRPLWLRIAVLALIGVLLAGAYAAVPRFGDRIDAVAVELHDAFVDHRIDTNQGKRVAGAVVAGRIIADNPVLGTGLGANMIEFRRRLDTEFPQFRDAVGWFPHLHNQYLQITTETGLLGLLSMLAIFATLIFGKYRHPGSKTAAIALSTAYLIGFLGDPFLHKQMTLVLFATAAGIISADDEAFTEYGDTR